MQHGHTLTQADPSPGDEAESVNRSDTAAWRAATRAAGRPDIVGYAATRNRGAMRKRRLPRIARVALPQLSLRQSPAACSAGTIEKSRQAASGEPLIVDPALTQASRNR